MLNVLGELSSEERLFYYQLALIWQAVLVPVVQSGKGMMYWLIPSFEYFTLNWLCS
jgi:hypothetical protein